VFSTNIRAAQHPYQNPATVCLAVTIHDSLSGLAYNTLRQEASRIWLRHGIALTWTSPAATGASLGRVNTSDCAALIPVIFDEDELRKLAGGKIDDALARTVFRGRSQTIYVSAPRAFKMVSVLLADPLGDTVSRALRDGTLLGRIVAHELGHVLLTTTGHSPAGLMKPVFDLRDVLSPDDAQTDLSLAETTRLVMRFSLMPKGPNNPPTKVGRAR
jgi:hypothetical protein